MMQNLNLFDARVTSIEDKLNQGPVLVDREALSADTRRKVQTTCQLWKWG